MSVSHKVGASLPSDHDFPVDQAIQELMLTPPVAMQLLPRPSRAVPERVNRPGPAKGSPKGRGKSPAKSKGRGKAQPSFPAPLQGKGLKGRNLQGELLCWNYNMERPCQKKPCQLKHQCMKCFGSHPYTLCTVEHEPANSVNAMASSGSFNFGCSAAGPLLPPPSFSFPSQPAASFPFTNDPAPTLCRHAPVHPATSPSEDSQAPVPAGFAPVLPSASFREALPKAPVPAGSAPVRPSASPGEALPKAPVPSGSAPVRPSAPLAGAFPLMPFLRPPAFPRISLPRPIPLFAHLPAALCGRDLCWFVQLFFHSRLHGFSVNSSRSCTSKAVACFAVGLARAWRPTVAAQHTPVLAAGPGGACTPVRHCFPREGYSSLQQWETHCAPAPFGPASRRFAFTSRP